MAPLVILIICTSRYVIIFITDVSSEAGKQDSDCGQQQPEPQCPSDTVEKACKSSILIALCPGIDRSAAYGLF